MNGPHGLSEIVFYENLGYGGAAAYRPGVPVKLKHLKVELGPVFAEEGLCSGTVFIIGEWEKFGLFGLATAARARFTYVEGDTKTCDAACFWLLGMTEVRNA